MGLSIRSKIAVDDFVTGPGCIPYNQDLPSSTTPASIITSTNLTILACNFECNCPCSWNLDPTNDMPWKVKKGPSDIIFTGPSADHTLQSTAGHYAYIETNVTSLNNAARLISPLVSVGSTGLCFQFFYHMYGTNINRLNLYTKQNGNLGKAVWQKIGEQGNRWILGQVYLEYLSNVQFVIEGVAGNGAR